MRAKFGSVPTAVSKNLSFNFIIGYSYLTLYNDQFLFVQNLRWMISTNLPSFFFQLYEPYLSLLLPIDINEKTRQTEETKYLTQHVLEPTRAARVLDIVLSSQKEFVDNVVIQEPLGSSDHNQLHFNIINIKSDKTKVKQCRRDFRKGNYKKIRKSLALMDWNPGVQMISLEVQIKISAYDQGPWLT